MILLYKKTRIKNMYIKFKKKKKKIWLHGTKIRYINFIDNID